MCIVKFMRSNRSNLPLVVGLENFPLTMLAISSGKFSSHLQLIPFHLTV